MSQDAIAGIGNDGADLDAKDPAVRFMADLRERQEAIWAVLAHGSVRFDGQVWWIDDADESHFSKADTCMVYLPRKLGQFDVNDWLETNSEDVFHALGVSARLVAGQNCSVQLNWILPIPTELVDFVAKNTSRPMPRRFNSTAVTYTERDGITWLTYPEVKLYDALRAAEWTFIPQPAFVFGSRAHNIPDFVLFWKGRADAAVVIEIDSDMWHQPPSARKDEAKSQYFQARNFAFMRFSAKECDSPERVVERIRKFCIERFGA